MLLKEQFHTIYKGMSFSCSPQTFLRNVRTLQKKYKLPRGQAMAVAYALLCWACERMASSVRAQLGGTEKKMEDVAKSFLTAQELKEVEAYKEFIDAEESMMDPLREISEIDAVLSGKKTILEQRIAVSDAVASMEADLKKAILVGLAHMMRSMGYERWPKDPEGRADIEDVIEIVSRDLVRMGRRFNSLMRDQFRVLKRVGPKRYEQIIRRWLSGQPEELDVTEESPEGKELDGDAKCHKCGRRYNAFGQELKDFKDWPADESDELKKNEQVVPNKVGADWWGSASFAERTVALMDLAGMPRAEASVVAKDAWNRLPGVIRASLEQGVSLAVEEKKE